jgi:hypothetical protein
MLISLKERKYRVGEKTACPNQYAQKILASSSRNAAKILQYIEWEQAGSDELEASRFLETTGAPEFNDRYRICSKP